MTELGKRTVEELLEEIAAATPSPGGGTAAALAGALAAALLEMAAAISLRKAPDEATLLEAKACAERLRAGLLELADLDAAAYGKVVEAYRLPKETEAERKRRAEKIQEALKGAAEVPLRTAQLSLEVLETAGKAAGKVRKSIVSDLLVSARLAHAAVHSALYNVDINVASLEDPGIREELERKRRALAERTEEVFERLSAG